MKVIIPVAGFGTRLRPHTLTKAKVLMNVAGKPMISYIIDQIIKDKLASEIILITGFLGEQIEEYLNTNYKFKFTFVKQEEPLGLGHAIYTAKNYLYEKLNEDLLIILGDTLFDVKLKNICKGKYSRITVKKVNDPKRFGVVEKDKKGFVTHLIEKPSSPEVSTSNEAIVGIYFIKNGKLLFECLEHNIKNDIKTKNEFQLTDALEKMLQLGEKMDTYKIDGWLDCGKPETILETNRYLLNKLKKNYKFKTSVIKNPVSIAKGVWIEKSKIGPGVTIGENCKIRNCIIKNSIIHSGSIINDCKLIDSIIGDNCIMNNLDGKFYLGDFSEISG